MHNKNNDIPENFMVDALSPESPFTRANQTQTDQTAAPQNPIESVRTSVNNNVNALPQDGVEVILTQAERVAEELTYENLRPNRSTQGNIESNNEGKNAADEALNSDALEGSRL